MPEKSMEFWKTVTQLGQDLTDVYRNALERPDGVRETNRRLAQVLREKEIETDAEALELLEGLTPSERAAVAKALAHFAESLADSCAVVAVTACASAAVAPVGAGVRTPLRSVVLVDTQASAVVYGVQVTQTSLVAATGSGRGAEQAQDAVRRLGRTLRLEAQAECPAFTELLAASGLSGPRRSALLKHVVTTPSNILRREREGDSERVTAHYAFRGTHFEIEAVLDESTIVVKRIAAVGG